MDRATLMRAFYEHLEDAQEAVEVVDRHDGESSAQLDLDQLNRNYAAGRLIALVREHADALTAALNEELEALKAKERT